MQIGNSTHHASGLIISSVLIVQSYVFIVSALFRVPSAERQHTAFSRGVIYLTVVEYLKRYSVQSLAYKVNKPLNFILWEKDQNNSRKNAFSI